MAGYEIATIGALGDVRPCCSACADKDEYRGPMGGAHDEAIRMGDMGKLLPTFVTPQSVRDLKDRLKPQFITTDADVRACAALTPAERASWDGFASSWENYRTSEETFWGVTAEYDAGVLFEQSLLTWQTQLEGRCKLSGPKVVLPPTDAAGADTLSAIKWVAIAVAAVAVVYVASPFVMGAQRVVSR